MISPSPLILESRRRDIKVTYADGNTVSTWINGTEDEIRSYYIGNFFQFGDTDSRPYDYMVMAINVEFFD